MTVTWLAHTHTHDLEKKDQNINNEMELVLRMIFFSFNATFSNFSKIVLLHKGLGVLHGPGDTDPF